MIGLVSCAPRDALHLQRGANHRSDIAAAPMKRFVAGWSKRWRKPRCSRKPRFALSTGMRVTAITSAAGALPLRRRMQRERRPLLETSVAAILSVDRAPRQNKNTASDLLAS